MSDIYSPMPRLGTASSKTITQEVLTEYKSGAVYKGQVRGTQRTGHGTFTWSNGGKYEGEYVNNMREGNGKQTWPDGSTYDGDFVDDLRQGEGTHAWANDEDSKFPDETIKHEKIQTYSGTFFRDRRHGQGMYTWPDGATYVGTFYMDRREGYGKMTFANGNSFEGLYKQDEREGPGVLTYPDGRQDVGMWHRQQLVKLCSALPGAFSMVDHPEFEYYPEEHYRYLNPENFSNKTNVFHSILNPPEPFQYPPQVDVTENTTVIFSDSLDPQSMAIDVKIFEEEFFKEALIAEEEEKTRLEIEQAAAAKETSRANSMLQEDPKRKKKKGKKPVKEKDREETTMVMEESDVSKDKPEPTGVKAWNLTPSSVLMQTHCLRHAFLAKTVAFDVEKVIKGERSGFGEKGAIELASEEFLKAAAEGDLEMVKNMLNKNIVAVDVTDRHGHSALIAAGVNWHQDIINCLLDNGADVNKLNDEGISSLGACHVFFYPIDSFKYNIAERYLSMPDNFEAEKGYDVNEAVKSLIPTSPRRRPSSLSERKSTQTDFKKIQKLRQEYGSSAMQRIAEGLRDNKENEDDGDRGNSADSGVNSMADGGLERKLGSLKVRRVTKTNVDEMMEINEEALNYPESPDKKKAKDFVSDEDEDYVSESEIDDFESLKSVHALPIEVSDQLIERCATQLSTNEMVVGRKRSANITIGTVGTVRRLAMDKSHHVLMESTIRLLLKRGADPNASAVPMPVLFFAIKAADVSAVRELLVKGASTTARLSDKKGGLAPLHIAAAIPGEEGVRITELLLDSLAHPDVRATMDDSFLNRSLEEEWCRDVIDEKSQKISGGRTPLQIACARDDNYKNACRVVHLLLRHHANPNLLCNGHSPLALAIASGNDMAIDELLLNGACACLPLTHGVGSALCIASSTEYDNRRTPEARIKLIDKLIRADANILAPILIGPKRVPGTAVDYAYYMYNLAAGMDPEVKVESDTKPKKDRRIAHMPYHALTHAERETFNARRGLLAHVGDILRIKAVERERMRLDDDHRSGKMTRSPSPNFVYTGAGAKAKKQGGVSFGKTPDHMSVNSEGEARKPMFRYCYECGRSVGVRLSPCTRCKEVHYCSKACKLKAWNARHKEECVRVGGRGRSPSQRGRSKSPSPSRGNRIDSPTPTADPDQGKPTTVAGIMGAPGSQRVKLPPISKSGSKYGDYDAPHSLPSSPFGSQASLVNSGHHQDGSEEARRSDKDRRESEVRRSNSWDGSEVKGKDLSRIAAKNAWVGGAGNKKRSGRKYNMKTHFYDDEEDYGSYNRPPKNSSKYGHSDRDPKNIHFGDRRSKSAGKIQTRNPYNLDNINNQVGIRSLKGKQAQKAIQDWKQQSRGHAASGGRGKNSNYVMLKVPAKGRSHSAGTNRLAQGHQAGSQGPYGAQGPLMIDQIADPLVREEVLMRFFSYNPWKIVDGKWVYVDNYSYN